MKSAPQRHPGEQKKMDPVTICSVGCFMGENWMGQGSRKIGSWVREDPRKDSEKPNGQKRKRKRKSLYVFGYSLLGGCMYIVRKKS